uniref:Uncharacterized protein n=1 Tax=Ditylenchus dipsaci TaxID=166011 RepID=A0A915ETW6_9BILA
MEFLFGRRKTPQELLRQNQRALNKAMRELDRERQRLEMSEKKIIADIKKMAKLGQMDSVRVMAKDLVRTRQYVKNVKESGCNGSGYERRYSGHEEHESATETSGNPEDYDGNHGHERRNDGGRRRRCDG